MTVSCRPPTSVTTGSTRTPWPASGRDRTARIGSASRRGRSPRTVAMGKRFVVAVEEPDVVRARAAASGVPDSPASSGASPAAEHRETARADGDRNRTASSTRSITLLLDQAADHRERSETLSSGHPASADERERGIGRPAASGSGAREHAGRCAGREAGSQTDTSMPLRMPTRRSPRAARRSWRPMPASGSRSRRRSVGLTAMTRSASSMAPASGFVPPYQAKRWASTGRWSSHDRSIVPW